MTKAPEQRSFAGFGAPPRPADRLFFAVFPDEEAASRMAQFAARLCAENEMKGWPLQAGRLHVTLHHLGDYVGLPHGVVADASKAAMDLSVAPFDVVFDRAESFKGRPGNRPLVLRGGDGLAKLTAFQQALGAAMVKTGLGRRIDRNFTPHVTLAYGDGEIRDLAVDPIGWTVREFVLVHSLLGRTRHIPLARWPL
jgi:2'-5' RNA ligase